MPFLLMEGGEIRSHFETIHPFVDGNGRTGRLLITLFLWQEQLLEIPVLYLSDFFKKHQSIYYNCLQKYHGDSSDVEGWLLFFLDGVIDTAKSAIQIAKGINAIREEDMNKIHKLGKTAAANSVEVLRHLFKQPIVDVKTIQKWTKFSKVGAQRTIDRFVDMGILSLRDPRKIYRRTYSYGSYLSLFRNADET